MKPGIVTYQVAADWTLEEIIERCGRLGYAGVELRAGHRHGVEVSLGARERREIRRRFADLPVELVGLGSAFDFHHPEPDRRRRNIEGAREYLALAADVGAGGIKVRPNDLPDGVPAGVTIERIGLSLRETAGFADGLGLLVRLEVHGRKTADPAVIRRIVEAADHPALTVCWNSNPGEIDENGSISRSFEMLRDKIELVHLHDLDTDYPWRELFRLLGESGYAGYCLAEIPASADPERVLRYYRALFREMSGEPDAGAPAQQEETASQRRIRAAAARSARRRAGDPVLQEGSRPQRKQRFTPKGRKTRHLEQ